MLHHDTAEYSIDISNDNKVLIQTESIGSNDSTKAYFIIKDVTPTHDHGAMNYLVLDLVTGVKSMFQVKNKDNKLGGYNGALIKTAKPHPALGNSPPIPSKSSTDINDTIWKSVVIMTMDTIRTEMSPTTEYKTFRDVRKQLDSKEALTPSSYDNIVKNVLRVYYRTNEILGEQIKTERETFGSVLGNIQSKFHNINNNDKTFHPEMAKIINTRLQNIILVQAQVIDIIQSDHSILKEAARSDNEDKHNSTIGTPDRSELNTTRATTENNISFQPMIIISDPEISPAWEFTLKKMKPLKDSDIDINNVKDCLGVLSMADHIKLNIINDILDDKWQFKEFGLASDEKPSIGILIVILSNIQDACNRLDILKLTVDSKVNDMITECISDLKDYKMWIMTATHKDMINTISSSKTIQTKVDEINVKIMRNVIEQIRMERSRISDQYNNKKNKNRLATTPT